MEYVPTALSPDDMQMLDSRRFQVSDIARFWRVPPHMIGDTEKSTSWGTGIEQQNLGFFAVHPATLPFPVGVRGS